MGKENAPCVQLLPRERRRLDGFECQDRLGTNVRKYFLKRGRRFETQDPHAVPKSQIHGDEDTSDYVDAARQAIRASTDFNCGQDYRGFLEDVVVRFVTTNTI